jgi:diguanylate cyclase (GGDEF)-like protein
LILDVRTMGIFSAVTPFILGFIMLIYWRERKVYGGFGRWVLANFCLGTGYLFGALRGFIPDSTSVILGNAIIVYCVILLYEGIEDFYARPAFSRLNYLIFGCYLLAQSYLTYIDPNINVRVALSSLLVSFLIFRSALKLFRGGIPELRQTSRSAGYLFVGTALLPFVRAIVALLQPSQIDFFTDPLNSWFSIVFIISMIAWTFYFFFLNSARLELDLETARAELDVIARTDSLTNLYNRRHFDEYAQVEFRRAKRYGYMLSFLVLDVDNFKSVNDCNGHGVGDAVLLSLSEILRSEVRPFDLLARFGGDEFLFMLVDTDEEQAYSIAERIRNLVEQTAVVFDSHNLNVCVSVGLTTVQPGDMDLRLILKRADDALYRAKQEGRNRVEIA